MAGTASITSNPIIEDFNLLAHNLEQLGFVLNHGKVLVIPPLEDE